jgi:phosphate transport system permease protein
LLVLPIIILSTREALKAIPPSIREASYALGASKWQTISYQVLPAAMPGILTGTILAMSRAIGETAPLITIGALTYVAFLPASPISSEFPFVTLRGLLDAFSVLPIQIFNWVSRPQKGFFTNAAAGIIVLLIITFLMNGIAVWLRHKYQKRIRW